MSAKSFLTFGAQVKFDISLGESAVLYAPAIVPVTSKSKNTASFKGITVEGDEKQWVVPSCPYINPPRYIIPGFVKCSIEKLDSSQLAEKILENGKKVILVGTKFKAKFEVLPGMGAKEPPKAPGDPPKIDTEGVFMGTGKFIQPLDPKAQNT